MTLLIYSPTIIANPVKYLPDLDRGLSTSITPATIVAMGLSDGASVASLVAAGIGDLADRTYSLALTTNRTRPTYDADGGAAGGAALAFGVNAHLGNAISGNARPERAQPITRAFRLFLPSWAPASQNGFCRGWQAGFLQTIRTGASSTGQLILDFGTQVDANPLTMPVADWFTLIVCADGADSWARVNGGPKCEFNAGTNPYNGEYFGASTGTDVTTQTYRMDRYDKWYRRLSPDEATVWASQNAP